MVEKIFFCHCQLRENLILILKGGNPIFFWPTYFKECSKPGLWKKFSFYASSVKKCTKIRPSRFFFCLTSVTELALVSKGARKNWCLKVSVNFSRCLWYTYQDSSFHFLNECWNIEKFFWSKKILKGVCGLPGTLSASPLFNTIRIEYPSFGFLFMKFWMKNFVYFTFNVWFWKIFHSFLFTNFRVKSVLFV